MTSHNSKPIHIVGGGLVAATLAALWPEPISCDALTGSFASWPLFIQARHEPFLKKLDIPYQIMTTLCIQHDLGEERWKSQDFALPYFGFVIDAKNLWQALLAASPAASAPCENANFLVALGKQPPPIYPCHMEWAMTFSVHRQIHAVHHDAHTIGLRIDPNGQSTQLPGGEHIQTLFDHGEERCYLRESLREDVLFMGDSLLSLPPTLALGYNGVLAIIASQQQNHFSWSKLRLDVIKRAKRQFLMAKMHHRALHPLARPALIGMLKNPKAMAWLLEMLMYAGM